MIWKTHPDMDISGIYNFQSYYPRAFVGIFEQHIRKFGLHCAYFSKDHARRLPDLKEHISPWHLVLKDTFIIQTSKMEWQSAVDYFKNHPSGKLKGLLSFQNTSFLVVLKNET